MQSSYEVQSAQVIEAIEVSTGRKIWRVKDVDMCRLYKLWMWSQRYSVPLEYVTKTLVEYFAKGVEKSTGRKSKGLGVNINTLTGTAAEEVLERCIARDFPENDHLSIYREQQREAIYNIVDHEQIPTRPKNVLDYKTLDDATKALIASIRLRRKRYEKVARLLSTVPYRDNPFR